MHKHLYFLALLPLFGCAAEDLERDSSGPDAGIIESDGGVEAEGLVHHGNVIINSLVSV